MGDAEILERAAEILERRGAKGLLLQAFAVFSAARLRRSGGKAGAER